MTPYPSRSHSTARRFRDVAMSLDDASGSLCQAGKITLGWGDRRQRSRLMGVFRRLKRFRRGLVGSAAIVACVVSVALPDAGATTPGLSGNAAVTPPDEASTSSRGVVG